MSQTASPKFGAVETTDKHDTTPLSSLPPTEKRTNDIEEKLAANTIRNDAVISGHHASQQMSRHDALTYTMEKHLARISDLLRKQQEQKSIREKEADYRRPFEQAAKASMEGVSSGSLIAIFIAALDAALLSYVQDALSDKELIDNPPTLYKLAITCFYTSMLLAVLAMSYYGLMAFKCYHDLQVSLIVARPKDLGDQSKGNPIIQQAQKLFNLCDPGAKELQALASLAPPQALDTLLVMPTADVSQVEPRRSNEAPSNSEGEQLKPDIPDLQLVHAGSWESAIVTVKTYKFTLVSLTWPSMLTLVIGLVLLAWARHPGMVAKITTIITGIFLFDFVLILATDSSYLIIPDLFECTSVAIQFSFLILNILPLWLYSLSRLAMACVVFVLVLPRMLLGGIVLLWRYMCQ